jgi:putative DNA primase/helicase
MIKGPKSRVPFVLEFGVPVMDELKVVPLWLPKVEAAVAKFPRVDDVTVRLVCDDFRERIGPEAEAKARELFAARRAELAAKANSLGSAAPTGSLKSAAPIGERQVVEIKPPEPLKLRRLGEPARAIGSVPKAEAAGASGKEGIFKKLDGAEADDEPDEAEGQAREDAKPEGPPRLNLSAPLDVAKTFIRRARHREDDGKEGNLRYAFIGMVEGKLVQAPMLRRWQKDFYHWNGQCYETVEDEAIRAQVYDFLDRSIELDGRRLKPKQKNVNEVIDALISAANFGATDVPVWIGKGDGRPEPKGLLACRNGLLEFETGRLWDHDPRFFGINSVDFDFDPEASCPRWERFLGEVFPGDGEAVGTLQEFFGLWLTDETKFQKACVLIGPPRSGKGTVGRLLRGLLGRTSFAAVSLQTLGADQFGMEHLIGKKLALVPDVKLDGRANITLVMERLLTTIGEDEQSINRKNQKYWLGRLGVRWLILGNDIPKFRGTDEQGALAKRCIMLAMEQDFFGREDFELTEKLLAERAGILNWAMVGWRRLRERGRFVQPKSGMGLVERLRASTSTMGAFIDECCVVDAEEKVPCEAIWQAFCEWSERRKLPVTLRNNTFSWALHKVFPSIVTSRPGAANNIDGRARWFYGVRLRDGWRRSA